MDKKGSFPTNKQEIEEIEAIEDVFFDFLNCFDCLHYRFLRHFIG